MLMIFHCQVQIGHLEIIQGLLRKELKETQETQRSGDLPVSRKTHVDIKLLFTEELPPKLVYTPKENCEKSN